MQSSRDMFGYENSLSQRNNPLMLNPLNLAALGIPDPSFLNPEFFVTAQSQSRMPAKNGMFKYPFQMPGLDRVNSLLAAAVTQENNNPSSPSEQDSEVGDSDADKGFERNSLGQNDSLGSSDGGDGDGGESNNGALQRGLKRSIPVDEKDDKYFERRRRNNMAAKKSRDARKNREDHLAMRVAYLEKENAVFRAQVAVLREEMIILRLFVCQKANGNSSAEESP